MIAHRLQRLDEVIDFAPEADDRAAAIGGLSISIRCLRKAFGANEVLRGIDLHVRSGQFVAIVGRSGCGKSTLLRLLLGLDQPSRGEFWFGEHADEKPDASAVRIMFQEPRLLPWAKVLANVEVGLGKDRSSPGARERAISTLREVGLEDRSNEWPSVLSGGQKQRVVLARALVSRPRVLAFDEPLGRARRADPHLNAEAAGGCLARSEVHRHHGDP